MVSFSSAYCSASGAITASLHIIWERVGKHIDARCFLRIVAGSKLLTIQIHEKKCRRRVGLCSSEFVLAEACHAADNQKNQKKRNIALENGKALQAKLDNIIDVHFFIVIIITDIEVFAFICILRTANYEPENTDDPAWRAIYEKRCKEAGFSAYFDYSWQWAYKKKFKGAGLTALLGCGFDPGVTQAYCAYAAKHEFDTIDTIDILDCNGGDHGYAFATNFNPEINLREVSAPGSYWENGHWVEIPAMSIKREYDFAQVGHKDMYLLHHEEIESLGKNMPDVKRIRFFMTFGQSYLDHMRCLEDVGMLSTTPINYNGQEIVPIQFLKALLPDPASLGPRTKGKTNIGCIFTGAKDGAPKTTGA